MPVVARTEFVQIKNQLDSLVKLIESDPNLMKLVQAKIRGDNAQPETPKDVDFFESTKDYDWNANPEAKGFYNKMFESFDKKVDARVNAILEAREKEAQGKAETSKLQGQISELKKQYKFMDESQVLEKMKEYAGAVPLESLAKFSHQQRLKDYQAYINKKGATAKEKATKTPVKAGVSPAGTMQKTGEIKDMDSWEKAFKSTFPAGE